MNKIITSISLIFLICLAINCKKTNDLSPNLPKKNMAAIFSDKNEKNSEDVVFPVCREFWMEGPEDVAAQQANGIKLMYENFGRGAGVDSCEAYKEKAYFACKIEHNNIPPIILHGREAYLKGIIKAYYIIYFLNKDEKTAKSLCRAEGSYEKVTFIKY